VAAAIREDRDIGLPPSQRRRCSVEPIVQINGAVAVPGGAGPGIEIDRAVIERYRVP
jgi:hypothetical protein